jgi:hypothetical protein
VSDLLFDPHWWEQKFQFTDEQWQAIVQPLQSAKTKQEDRLTLELIARRHGRLRSEESFQFSRGKTRSRLEFQTCRETAGRNTRGHRDHL